MYVLITKSPVFLFYFVEQHFFLKKFSLHFPFTFLCPSSPKYCTSHAYKQMASFLQMLACILFMHIWPICI